MPLSQSAPVFGPAILLIVGYSNSGKTRLMTRLIETLTSRGLRVGAVKHHSHNFEMDHPGKDTWKFKQAGAKTTVISSPSRIGMVRDVDHDHDPSELAGLMPNIDIVLVEGYKRSDYPKIEVFRAENEKPPACQNDGSLIAVVSDTPLGWGVPQFATESMSELSDFIMHKLNITV